MKTLLLALLAWVAPVSGYDEDLPAPSVAFYTVGGLAAPTLADNREVMVVAAYNPDANTIILRSDFDPENAEHLSDAVHELVHYAQDMSGVVAYRCKGKLEREAYMIENEWRQEKGLEPIDDLLIMRAELLAGGECVPH